MLLAIDIGNSNTVFAVFQGVTLCGLWRVETIYQQTEDEIVTQIKSLLANINTEEIDGVGISSVVPDKTDIFDTVTRKYFSTEPMIVHTSLNLGIKIYYDDPTSLGADRLCNAIAGYAKYGGPIIIIDFGTATTYNVIASNGDFLGGVIAPGIETSAVDLYHRAAKLPKVELSLPIEVIGKNTISSMQAGILLGAVDAVEGMIKRIQKELQLHKSKEATVVATGGFSEFMSKQTSVIQYIEPTLVLEGVRLIYEKLNWRDKRRQ